jgi:predicted XRE-type DNA-binding protein
MISNWCAAAATAAADFSRIRRAKLDRFTIDRLMMVLGRLDQRVEIAVSFKAA